MHLPDLEDRPKQQQLPSRRDHQQGEDPECFDADFSDFSASSANGDRRQALSDVGVSSDFTPAAPTVDIVAELKARKEERSLASAEDCHSSFRTQDEKKDEEAEMPSVGNLKSQWEKREAERRMEAMRVESKPNASPTRTSPSRPASAFDREKVSTSQSNDEIEEISSFASVREQLRPVAPSSRSAYSSGPKSEAGAPGNSQFNSILSELERARVSRDSQSDVGAPQRKHPGLTVSTDGPRFAERNQHIQPTHSEDSATKRTYREQRDLELKQRKAEEERARISEPTERDVATLIKRRIAANKKNTAAEERDNLSNGLVYTESMKPYDESPRPGNRKLFEVTVEDRSAISRDTPSRLATTRPTELHIAQQPQPKHDTAVSHLLMLQQLQQRTKTDEDTVPPRPRSETSEPYSEDRNHKSTTPKATMMMLNAFLAGRDSLASSGPVSGKGSVQSSHDGANDKRVGDSTEDGPSLEADLSSRIPARKDDPKYERYYKMLKIGMTVDVVKHAMTRDGLDPTILDGDPNSPVGIPLKLDPEYSKYFKMLAIGLPMEAVKHAMARDGLDSSVMDQDHDLPLQRQKLDADDEEPKEKDSHRRARLHWKTLRSVTSNSLWAKIDQDDELGKIKFNEKEFQELFQAEKATEAAQKGASTSIENKRGGVRVIDPKRANNGGIILARLKMSHDDMADAVDGINERALSAEQIENIIEYLPTKDERKALETYMLEGGQDAAEKFDGLCECEKFMVSMMTVKHAKRKVRALLFKLQFQSCLEDIHRDTLLMETACDELCNSVRLRKLLGIVLTFGNRLNTAGNGKHRAGAFTLDSLLKLNQAKAFDKKTTFLHYIVLIVQRNNELLLRFKDDIPTVFKADRVYWDQCINDLEEVEHQLENVRKIALYQARQATMYRLRKKKREEDEESLSSDENELSLEEEVEALRASPIGMFTLSAIKYVSSLRDRVDETKAKYSRLLEYFGEEGNMQPHELFTTIVSFSRDFDNAKELVFANEKRKQREERKRHAVAANGMAQQHGRPPMHSPAQSERKASEQATLKASNHQPSMGHILDELKTRLDRPRSEIEEGKTVAASPPVHTKAEQRSELSAIESTPTGPADKRRTEPRSQASILADRERARKARESIENASSPEHQRASTSGARSQRAADRSPSTPAPATPDYSTPTQPMAGKSLKAKARMRRHRHSMERSLPASPSSLIASTPEPNRNSSSSVIMLSPIHVQARGSPPSSSLGISSGVPFRSADDDGAARQISGPVTPLSPRSSMRNRMERHKLRQQASSPAAAAGASASAR
jgi:hypothetical protein